MDVYAKLFGVFENSMTVVSDNSMFELTMRSHDGLQKSIADVGEMVRDKIMAAFNSVLKVTENINKVEKSIKLGYRPVLQSFASQ